MDGKPFSLSLQTLTVFAELSYGRRDFAKTEGRKTDKGMVERVAEGEVVRLGKKHSDIPDQRNLERRTRSRNSLLK